MGKTLNIAHIHTQNLVHQNQRCMLATIEFQGFRGQVHLAEAIDLSLPLRHGADNPNAFFLGTPAFTPFRAGTFVGSVAEGGACNCDVLTLAPHGNGTHTECIGHITPEHHSINQCLQQFFALAEVISVEPVVQPNGDAVITKAALQTLFPQRAEPVNALVLRTMPNGDEKRTRQYSGTNPPYLHHEAAAWLAECGIYHLVLDLPSVDREEDGGALLAHHAFWRYPSAPRYEATITELAYIPTAVADGLYVLALHIAPLETDASPSKPVLYKWHPA